MSLAIISTPEKTINGILSNVVAGRAQCPFEFLATDFDFSNYKVNVELLDITDTPLLDVIFKYSPKPDGSLFIDLGQVITEITEIFARLDERFKIEWYESYIDLSGDPFEGAHTITAEFLAIYGEKQILSLGGSNMFDFILKDPTAKLVTKFKNPLYWAGFNRTINYIMDSNYQSRTGAVVVQILINSYDINKTLISSLPIEQNFDLTPRLAIDSFIQTGSAFLGVELVERAEELIFERREVCESPIVVDWLNSLGGVEQHVFDLEQLFDRNPERGVISEKGILEDISGVNRTKARIAPAWTQQVILTAEDLTLDQYKALLEIRQSPSVRVWLNNSGSEWVGVITAANLRGEYQSLSGRYAFTLQLEMPDNFDITEATNYNLPTFDTLIDSDLEELIDSDLEILTG